MIFMILVRMAALFSGEGILSLVFSTPNLSEHNNLGVQMLSTHCQNLAVLLEAAL